MNQVQVTSHTSLSVTVSVAAVPAAAVPAAAVPAAAVPVAAFTGEFNDAAVICADGLLLRFILLLLLQTFWLYSVDTADIYSDL